MKVFQGIPKGIYEGVGHLDLVRNIVVVVGIRYFRWAEVVSEPVSKRAPFGGRHMKTLCVETGT